MMKLNFYLMAGFPAKSNKENLICQIILPDRNTAHSSLFEYMVLILVGFKHKYFHFIDTKIFLTNKEWRICIGWTLIIKYGLNCCSYLNLHLPHWQCTGHDLLQMLARIHCYIESYCGLQYLWVASWSAQHQMGSQGWIEMTLHSICRNQNLKLHKGSVSYFVHRYRVNLACVAGAGYYFFTGRARGTREGERRPPLLFSPSASSRFLSSP